MDNGDYDSTVERLMIHYSNSAMYIETLIWMNLMKIKFATFDKLGEVIEYDVYLNIRNYWICSWVRVMLLLKVINMKKYFGDQIRTRIIYLSFFHIHSFDENDRWINR